MGPFSRCLVARAGIGNAGLRSAAEKVPAWGNGAGGDKVRDTLRRLDGVLREGDEPTTLWTD